VILGTAAPVLKQLGFSARVGEDRPYTDQVTAQWTLSDVAIDRIEQSRNGGSVTFWPNIQYALISQGTAAPDWPQPQVPIRVPFPENPTAVRIEGTSVGARRARTVAGRRGCLTCRAAPQPSGN
jgi:hypothetical protein